MGLRSFDPRIETLPFEKLRLSTWDRPQLDDPVGVCEELMAQAVVSGAAVCLQAYPLFVPTLFPV